MKRWLLAFVATLVPLSLHAQPADLSGDNVTGGATSRSLANLAATVGTTVANYAALKAFNPALLSANNTVCTAGYTSSGDGGDACYSWVAADSNTADTVIRVASTAATGNWLLHIPGNGVRVEVAGAKCDYSFATDTGTDDHGAFNTLMIALSSLPTGGRMLLGPGKQCLFNSGVGLVLNAGVVIEGAQPVMYFNSAATVKLASGLVMGSVSTGQQVYLNQGSGLIDVRVSKRGLALGGPSNMESLFATLKSWQSANSSGVLPQAADVMLDNVEIIGFNKCISSIGGSSVTMRNIAVDCINGIDETISGQTNSIYNLLAEGHWSTNLAGHLAVWTVPSGVPAPASGGTSYTNGDVLTVPGGTCATNPTLTATVSGGVVTAYTITDTGDCTVVPFTLQLGSATLPGIQSGGSGYALSSTFTVTLVGGTNTTAAQVSVTTNGSGVVTTVNSVVTPGSYTFVPQAATATTGGAGTGLTLLPYFVQAPVALTGGTGTGATAVPFFASNNFRAGTCVNIHDTADNTVLYAAQCGGYHQAFIVSNVTSTTFFTPTAEGDTYDIGSIGFQDLQCDTSTALISPWLEHWGIVYDFANNIPGGGCPSGHAPYAAIRVIGGHTGNFGGIPPSILMQMESGSTGTIQGMEINGYGAPAAVVVKSGVLSWVLDGLLVPNGNSLPNPWINVATSSIPNVLLTNSPTLLATTPSYLLPVQNVTATGTVYQLAGATEFKVTATGPGGNGGIGIACGAATNCSGGSGGGAGSRTESEWTSWSSIGASSLSVTIGGHAGQTSVGGGSFVLGANFGGDGFSGNSAASSGGGGGGGWASGGNGTGAAGGGSGGSGGAGAITGGFGAAPAAPPTQGGIGSGGGGGLNSGAGPAGGNSIGISPSGGGAGGGCTSGTTFAGGAGGTNSSTVSGTAGLINGGNGGNGKTHLGAGGGGSAASATNAGNGGAGGFPGGGGGGGGDTCNGGSGTVGAAGLGGAALVVVEQR